MNKRAGYIAFITFVYLVLIAAFRLAPYTFLAFVAFPLGLLQQGIVRKTPRNQWRLVLILENIFGMLVGIAVVTIINLFNSIFIYLVLSTVATYFISTQKPTVASTIFATMGMMYATLMQPILVFGMMLSGFALSQLATYSSKKIKNKLNKINF